MVKYFQILIFSLLISITYAQKANLGNGIDFEVSGGISNSMFTHTTPSISTDNGISGNWSNNDRIGFVPRWNSSIKLGYGLVKIPLRIRLNMGLQEHSNRHYAGLYSNLREYRPLEIIFRTFNGGLELKYDCFESNNHIFSVFSGVSLLYIPFNHLINKISVYQEGGTLNSRNQESTIDYYFLSNKVSTRYSLSWQLNIGLSYGYRFGSNWSVFSSVAYNLGISNLLTSSAVFYNSTSTNPGYYGGNTSYTVNKGDGLTVNLGIGYWLPLKGKAKRI
jgi:hypothetical protein